MISIALIGRTNVGKSTLFNRITGSAKALTSPLPHTTRDRNVATTVWRGVEIRCVDSGGVETLGGARNAERGTRSTIESEIQRQAERAATDADILVLVVDARDGVLPGERAIANALRAVRKPILVAWNKAETKRLRDAIGDAYALGFGDPIPTSAVTGMGVGDLLDQVVAMSREARGVSEADDAQLTTHDSRLTTRIAIVGEPNVGKSSLLNAILGHEEVIVRPEPFTTRDVHDVDIAFDDHMVTLLDTAGIRRAAVRARAPRTRGGARAARTTVDTIERLAVRRSLAAITRADVVLLVLDATAPATRHVKQLADAIVTDGRACVVVVNKMDLIPNFKLQIANFKLLLPHLAWAPVLAISATEGRGVSDLLPTAFRAAAAWRRVLPPAQLAAIHALVKQRIPKSRTPQGRKQSNILELQQIGTAPPAFLLHTRRRVKLPKAIPAIVERALRDSVDFAGSPIRITVKSVKS